MSVSLLLELENQVDKDCLLPIQFAGRFRNGICLNVPGGKSVGPSGKTKPQLHAPRRAAS
jgi:hypothetical protein